MVVLVVAFFFTLFDQSVIWVQPLFEFVTPALSLVFLTAGVFVLTLLFPGVDKSPLNPFWHIAFLCYGFSLFERGQKSNGDRY